MRYQWLGNVDASKKITIICAMLSVLLQLKDVRTLEPYMDIIQNMDQGRIYQQFQQVSYHGLLQVPQVGVVPEEECMEDDITEVGIFPVLGS